MAPPGIIAVFFNGKPPNATTKSVWSTTISQVVELSVAM
ncbi:hypothetical protein L842_6010 [Mycobacterium intracellulare MIN_052511_1280]|nr:hypothetical protein L842_6010 [Mycobacterium intracellulare MIN_052511_1280]